jgi:competence ComEA-like helix-hairpin-helix protein
LPVCLDAERRGGWYIVLAVLACAWMAPRPAPAPPPPDAPIPVDATHARSAQDSSRIDLNRAGAERLRTLPGIGPVLAARIVAHRERHGRFESAEDLRAVRGIGPRLLERLRPRLVISPNPSTALRDSVLSR